MYVCVRVSEALELELRTGVNFHVGAGNLWWFERKWPPKGVALLGGVALLEEVCHNEGGL